MKIINILGTRPQFVKIAVVYREMAKHSFLEQSTIDTGQHFDRNMRDIFLEDLGIPEPNYYLNINRMTHGAMVGEMLQKIEAILISENPDIVLVYGDTNSALAGALAAKKLHIKLAHIEAGLRSFNMQMPEEINRVLIDRISDILFCPTDTAVRNLKNEGFYNFNCRIVKSGDVMKDASLAFGDSAKKPDLNIPEKFILVTIHRAENVDNVSRLRELIRVLNKISEEVPIVFPIHPKTEEVVRNKRIELNVIVIKPLGYLEMIYLIKNCDLVITDSGGLQKEAFWFNKACLVLRNETEWIELVNGGFSMLSGAEPESIYVNYRTMIHKRLNFNVDLYGKGDSGKVIVEELLK